MSKNNKDLRELKETYSLFTDPRTQREAWRSVGRAILQNPAQKVPTCYDKDGNPTLASTIESYTYSNLCKDIKEIQGQDREPTELEMILGCQMLKARYDTQAAVFIRDTLGAKPIDESKMDATLSANPYDTLSDEELELIAAHRATKQEQNIDNQSEENDAE